MNCFILLYTLVNCVFSYEVIPISSEKFNFAYSPFWDCKTQSLYFVDYFQSRANIIRYDLNENTLYKASIKGEGSPIFIIPIKGCESQFAVGIERTTKIINLDGKSPEANVIRCAFSVENDIIYANNIFDQAKADPKGRFYGGTLRLSTCSNSTAANGALYRYSKKHGVKRIISDTNVAGGLGWNIKKKKFYFLNTCNYLLKEYNWNPNSGKICNGRVVFDFKCNQQTADYGPLGLAIDSDGMVFVSVYKASIILKIDPCTNLIVDQIMFPVSLVNAITFGGPDMKTLFVTTASFGFDIKNAGNFINDTSPLAGSIFMVKKFCAKGVPDRRVCL